jgi:hypothetical protein
MTWNRKLIYEWVKKLHMYSGLLTFTAFIVWGVTGVHAVFLPPPDQYKPPPVSSVQEIPFQTAGSLDDEQLARAIFDAISIPLAGGRYNVHRDEQLNLAFNVFTINGGREVTFLEKEGIVRIAHRGNSLWGYLSSMHTAHSRRHRLTPAAIAWGYFNEISTWAFLFMTFSGLYLWIATRPGLRWAQLSLAGMVAATLGLWITIR